MSVQLTRNHPQQAKIVEEEDAAAKRLGDEKKRCLTNMAAWSLAKNSTVSVAGVTAEDLISGILKQVVYNGVALSHFEGEGFQLSAGQMPKKLGVAVGCHAVRELVMQNYRECKEILMNELRDMFLYLKFNGVTRLRQHYLGQSVQWLDKNGAFQDRTLALSGTKAKSDARGTIFIKTKLVNMVYLFKFSQIYTKSEF